MTDYERNNRDDDRTDAAAEFIEWLNKEKGYQKNKTRGIQSFYVIMYPMKVL